MFIWRFAGACTNRDFLLQKHELNVQPMVQSGLELGFGAQIRNLNSCMLETGREVTDSTHAENDWTRSQVNKQVRRHVKKEAIMVPNIKRKFARGRVLHTIQSTADLSPVKEHSGGGCC